MWKEESEQNAAAMGGLESLRTTHPRAAGEGFGALKGGGRVSANVEKIKAAKERLLHIHTGLSTCMETIAEIAKKKVLLTCRVRSCGRGGKPGNKFF